MKITDKFTYKSKYSTYENCTFEVGRYTDDRNLALSISSETEGPICTCTVNTWKKLDDDRICVKNYSENEGMDNFLKGMGIIGEKVGSIPSGFVEIPVYLLTESGQELFKGV